MVVVYINVHRDTVQVKIICIVIIKIPYRFVNTGISLEPFHDQRYPNDNPILNENILHK